MLTCGSLFSGIGGFELGLLRSGLVSEIKWQVEIDDYATKVLEKNFPDVKRYKDIKDVGAHNLEPVGIICGGFPCTPFSVAGKRKGKEDDRYLWPEMFRCIKEIQPAWVIGENTPGFDTMALDDALSDLESASYEAVTFNIPACAVEAPHIRERIWIVAFSHSARGRCENRDIINKGRRASKSRGTCLPNTTKRKNSSTISDTGATGEDVADTTNTGTFGRKRVKGDDSRNGGTRGNHGTRGNTDIGCQDVADTSIPRLSKPQKSEQQISLLHAERGSVQNGNVPNADKINDDGRRFKPSEIRQQEPSGIQTCKHWLPEPDVGRVAHGIPSRVDRIKCLGNAVVPQVVQAIGELIKEFIEANQ